LFVTRVTGRVPHVEQELSALHPGLGFSGVRVAGSLVFCVMFCRSVFVLFSFFLLDIVLSVLQFKASDYPPGIFKLFLRMKIC